MSKFDELIKISKLANDSYMKNEIDDESVRKIYLECLKEYEKIKKQEKQQIEKEFINKIL